MLNNKTPLIDFESDEAKEYARSLKASVLARFSSEDLIQALKERANRRVIEFNAEQQDSPTYRRS